MQCFSFGRGGERQLGRAGDADERSSLPAAANLFPARVAGVAAGYVNSSAWTAAADGALWTCGAAATAGRGTQSAVPSSSPPLDPGPVALPDAPAAERVLQVSSAMDHSLVLTSAGRLLSFGLGSSGKLGHGDSSDRPAPAPVASLCGPSDPEDRIVQVAAGDFHSAALTAGGQVLFWGRRYAGRLQPVIAYSKKYLFKYRQRPIVNEGEGDSSFVAEPAEVDLGGARVASIACGSEHVLASTSDGSVFSWGRATYGRLGHGGSVADSLVSPHPVPAPRPIVQVAAGSHHSALLDEDGTVYTFGWGQHGRLGHGDEYSVYEPNPVAGLSPAALEGQRVVRIAAGYYSTAAVTDAGNVYVFGGLAKALLAQLQPAAGAGGRRAQRAPRGAEVPFGRPVAVPGLARCRDVSVGGFHALALCEA
eukprot:tig00000459_g1163.t1